MQDAVLSVRSPEVLGSELRDLQVRTNPVVSENSADLRTNELRPRLPKPESGAEYLSRGGRANSPLVSNSDPTGSLAAGRARMCRGRTMGHYGPGCLRTALLRPAHAR